MKRMRGIGALMLALLAGILVPIIIWVALIAAVVMMVQEWRLKRAPARTVGEILGTAGITIQWAGYSMLETPAAAIFMSGPVSVHELLARADL